MLGTYVKELADLFEVGERIELDIKEGELKNPQEYNETEEAHPK